MQIRVKKAKELYRHASEELQEFLNRNTHTIDDLKRIWKDTIEYTSQHTPTPIPDVPTDSYYESLLLKNKLEYVYVGF